MYKNTLYSFGAKGIAGICFFVLDILIARILGYDDYNEWSFYVSITLILKDVARLGIDTSSKTFIARSVNDKIEQEEFFKAGFRLEVSVCFVILLIELLISYPLSCLLGYPEKYEHLFLLIIAGVIYTATYSMLCFFKDASVGLLRHKNLFLITFVEFSGYLICALIGMSVGGIIGLGLGYSLAMCIANAYCIILYKDSIGCIKNNDAIRDKKRTILKYAISLIAVNLGALVLTEMDTFMLGIFSQKQVGIYAVSKNIVDKAINIPLALCLGAIPSYAIISKGNYKNKINGYKKLLTYYCGILIIIAIVFGILGKKAILLLYGDEYINSVPILYWLIPYFLLFSLTLFFSSFLSYQKKGKELMISHCIMMVANVLLNLALIPYYGAVGAAVATDISLGIFFIMLIVFHTKCLKEIKIMCS